MPLAPLGSSLPVPPSFGVTNLVSPCQGQPGRGDFWAPSGRVASTRTRPIQQQVVTRLGSASLRVGSSIMSWGQDLCRDALL